VRSVQCDQCVEETSGGGPGRSGGCNPEGEAVHFIHPQLSTFAMLPHALSFCGRISRCNSAVLQPVYLLQAGRISGSLAQHAISVVMMRTVLAVNCLIAFQRIHGPTKIGHGHGAVNFSWVLFVLW
jgi:hypothetical protein